MPRLQSAAIFWLMVFPAAARGDPAPPSDIYAYDMSLANFHTRVMMSSLMGNVNKTRPDGELMFMAYENNPAYSNPRFWLDAYVAAAPQTNVHFSGDPAFFIDGDQSFIHIEPDPLHRFGVTLKRCDGRATHPIP